MLLTCPEIALSQAKRILTSNGYVYFIVPNIFSIYNLPVDFADHILSRFTGKIPSHLHFFTKRRITAMFESEGFAIKKMDKLNNFLSRSWMGLAKKDQK